MTLLLLTALASPLNVSTSLEIDLDKLFPPAAPSVVCSDDMTRFKASPTPFDHDQPLKLDGGGQWVLRPGLLISECEAVEVINLRAEHKRQLIEIEAYRALLTKMSSLWQTAEVEYQQRIVDLNEKLSEAEERSWLERNAYVLGIATGIVAAGAAVWGAAQLGQAMK